ncbi:uncharacterized protein LOC143982946 [Lithobates pipiens]
MEWGMVPLEGGSLKSYVYLYQPEAPQIRDSRAQVFASFVNQGNCSLVIDPVGIQDNGFFQLRLSIDGNNYQPSPTLIVKVLEDSNQNYADPNSRSLDLNADNGYLGHPEMEEMPKYTLYLCIGGAILVVLLVASMGAMLYYELRVRKKKVDGLKLAEEGNAGPNSTDSEIHQDTSSGHANPPSADKDSHVTAGSKLYDMCQINENSAPGVYNTIPPEMMSEGLPLNFNVQVTYTCTCVPSKMEPSISSFNICVPPEVALSQSGVNLYMPATKGHHACTCVPALMCSISLLLPVASSASS